VRGPRSPAPPWPLAPVSFGSLLAPDPCPLTPVMAAAPTVDLRLIRNIGVIAHIDAGKTTTTEHLLYYAGAKHKLGGVDEGTTETDYDPEEQERGITIYSACVPLQWAGHTLNLIDTP